jgi:hypothetical protein
MPLTKDQFWHQMDLEMTQNAIWAAAANGKYTKEMDDDIFVREYKPFQVIK